MSMPNPRIDVDAGLVEALRRDDAHAAERLLERYADGLYRLAMRITGASEEAQAAVGEALWMAVHKIEMFRGPSTLGAWLYRMTVRAAYQRLLARRPRAGQVGLDDLLPPLDDEGRHFAPMHDWSTRLNGKERGGELQRALSAAIDALPAEHRTVLVLHDVEGMSPADIGEALGISLLDVKSRLHRSRLFLRQRLSAQFPPE